MNDPVRFVSTSIWGGRPSFARMDSVGGGGVVAEISRDPYSVGGGGSTRNFPGSIFFPLAPVTDPKFVVFSRYLQ